jgi:hypothetical protein
MMKPSRFTENETGIEVLVECPFAWEPYEKYLIVQYPSGRRYALPEGAFARLFTIVRPQNIEICAFGGVDDRPTGKQREAGEEVL